MIPPDDQSSPAGFSLDPASPLPAKLRGFYKNPYRDYVLLYGLGEKSGERTIKRWVSDGRHSNPVDLPPLDEQWKMAAWWRRVKPSQRPPQMLLALELEAPKPPPIPEPDPAAAPVNATAPQDQTPRNPEKTIAPIDLNDLSLANDEEVQQIRALVKANYQRVADASRLSDSDGYRRWFPIYNDSVEQLRKTEKEARERKKSSGDLLPKGPILAELAQLLESLRISRAVMPARIIAKLSEQASGRKRRVLKLIEADLAAAIEAVRRREDDLLMNVEGLRSTASAQTAFTLEAIAA